MKSVRKGIVKDMFECLPENTSSFSQLQGITLVLLKLLGTFLIHAIPVRIKVDNVSKMLILNEYKINVNK